MHAFTIASAAAILATSASAAALPVAAPVTPNLAARGLMPKLQPSSNAALDTPTCMWQSEDSLYVAFLALVPGVSSDAFHKAAKSDSACSGLSQYQGVEVGAKGTTLATVFWASDFCTADRVSKIIKKAGGGNIACKDAKKEETDVGPDALLAETFEGAEDGPEAELIKRDAETHTVKSFVKIFYDAAKKLHV